jgi:hypothetical protein
LSFLRTFAFIALFAAIQIVSLILMVPGWLICLSPALAKASWLWWNSDDGTVGATWWDRYVWLAWRNPVANLRRVIFVSGPGRPLLYHWWTQTPDDFKSGHYVKIGWESGTPFYPVMSGGAGRGF